MAEAIILTLVNTASTENILLEGFKLVNFSSKSKLPLKSLAGQLDLINSLNIDGIYTAPTMAAATGTATAAVDPLLEVAAGTVTAAMAPALAP